MPKKDTKATEAPESPEEELEASTEPEAEIGAPEPAEEPQEPTPEVVVDPTPDPVVETRQIFDDTPTSVTIRTSTTHSVNGGFYDLQAGKSYVFPSFVVDDLVRNGIGTR